MGSSKQNIIKAVILDMDGVLWRGEEPIGDLPAIFAEFARRHYRIALVTNNSTLSAELFIGKLKRFGVLVEPWQIISAGQAAADYLSKKYPSGGSVYIVGEIGLINDLETKGFFQSESDVLAVVSGLDRNLTYEKLAKACLLIQAGAFFLATNSDPNLVTPLGMIPGSGAIARAIETASGVKPLFIGKPSPEMFRTALERLECSPENALMVGDRLDTDMIGAQMLGCMTGLVLTGVSTAAEAQAWLPAIDWIAPNLTELLMMIATTNE